MSAQAVNGTTPTDPAAAAARVAAIEQMIAQAATGFSPAAPSATAATPAFSDVLASAASAGTAAAGAPSASPAGAYAPLIDQAAAQYGLNPAILTALVNQESGFNPNAVSSAGAEGLTQVMPENFAADGITNPFDPAQSISGGAKQLSADLTEFNGNIVDALAAYNAGSAAVKQYGGVPPYAQTQNYVNDILATAQQYEQEQSSPAAAATTVVEPTPGVSVA
jgi:soluble lytic murein transglycosylase-like protein